jgi:CheY-like chemotaxis protein
MSDTATLTAARLPVVYFIDDSATMREVIKIAFKKENVHVITCPDAASALAQFAEAAPDAVITDVIMPDKDGYEVCDFIKTHEQFGKTPVILMSGVVNKTVAERAMSVKADELMRKPFHPQDLIVRVKGLLGAKFSQSEAPLHAAVPAPGSQQPLAAQGPGNHSTQPAAQVLTNFFAPAQPAAALNPFPQQAHSAPPAQAANQPASSHAAFGSHSHAVQPAYPQASHPQASAAQLHPTHQQIHTAPQVSPAQRPAAPQAAIGQSADIQKLRNEVRRLELLVKKLQAELEASHQYCASLESHLNSLDS